MKAASVNPNRRVQNIFQEETHTRSVIFHLHVCWQLIHSYDRRNSLPDYNWWLMEQKDKFWWHSAGAFSSNLILLVRTIQSYGTFETTTRRNYQENFHSWIPGAGKWCYAILHLFFIGSWNRLVVVAVYVNLLLQSLWMRKSLNYSQSRDAFSTYECSIALVRPLE